jgi:hypothetical protein
VLRVSSNDPTGFISSESAIGVKLVLEYPFPGDDIGTGRMRDQCPSATIKKSLEFVLHGRTPEAG